MKKYSFAISAIAFLTITNTWANTAEAPVDKQLQQLDVHLPKALVPAQAIVEKLLVSHPNHPEVNYYCGVVYGLRAGEGVFSAMRYARKSRDCTEKAVTLEPTNLTYQLAALNYYLNAPAIVGGGESKARAKATDIAALDAVQGALAQLRVVNVFDADNYGKTLVSLVNRHPNDPRLELRLGLYKQQQGHYQAAHKLFSKAARNHFEDTELKAAQLNALYQVGRNAVFSGTHINEGITSIEQYIAVFDPALELPDMAWAHARLAQLMKMAGNEEGLEIQRQRAQQMGDANDDALHELLAQL